MENIRQYILEVRRTKRSTNRRRSHSDRPDIDPLHPDYSPESDYDFWFARNPKMIRALRTTANAASFLDSVVTIGSTIKSSVDAATRLYSELKQEVAIRKRKREYTNVSRKAIAFADALMQDDSRRVKKLSSNIRNDRLIAHQRFQLLYAAEVALALFLMDGAHKTEEAIRMILPNIAHTPTIQRKIIANKNDKWDLEGEIHKAKELIDTYQKKYRV